MRILIACEYSGIVRDAFIAKGHDAWSCDLLSSEKEGPHLQCNVLSILDLHWDMIIAHPPCTYLSYSGIKYWNRDGRKEKRDAAMNFFMDLYNAPIEKIAIENPVGYPNTVFRKPDQIIKPYYFGEKQMKSWCLWLKGLPKLLHFKEDDLFNKKTHVDRPEPVYTDKSGKKRYLTEAISGFSKDAQKRRSKTFQSFADAMADQWGTGR